MQTLYDHSQKMLSMMDSLREDILKAMVGNTLRGRSARLATVELQRQFKVFRKISMDDQKARVAKAKAMRREKASK